MRLATGDPVLPASSTVHIETVFQYQQRELLQLGRVARRRWSISRYILAAIVAACAIIPTAPTELRIAAVAAAAVMALLVEATLRRAARLSVKHEANAPRTYEITDESFISRQGAITRSLRWSDMHSVKRKGEWWHLHASEKVFTILPIRGSRATSGTSSRASSHPRDGRQLHSPGAGNDHPPVGK